MVFRRAASRLRRLLLSLSLPLTLLAAPTQAQVDLVARSIEGPGKAHVGRPVLVRIDIGSLGTPPFVNYTARIVISVDQFLDSSDPVVSTIQDKTLGPQGVVAEIPPLQQEGIVFFGLLVEPLPGETQTANNSVLGNACQIVRTELRLDDPGPIEFCVSASEPDPQSVVVPVSNAGSAGSVLVFTVEKLEPANWLTIDPPSGFAVGGMPGDRIELQSDQLGLGIGSYGTTVRFRNFVNPDDFQDLSLTLTVGRARFAPGDSIEGRIKLAGDVDLVEFDGLAGQLLTLRARTLRGDLQPRLEILDPDGRRESLLWFGNSGHPPRKSVRLKTSGDYRLRISGRLGSTGSYRLRTGRRLPGRARRRTVRARPDPGEDRSATVVLLLPGSELGFRVRPNSRFSGPLGLLFETPDGSYFDIAGFGLPAEDGGLLVSGIPITTGGRYVIRTTGFGTSAGAALRLSLFPVQPPSGRRKIYLR